MVADSGDDGQPKDLLGDPWTPPRDPRGRKRHKRLPQLAEKIAVLRGAGLTVEEIGARIGLSAPTLSKYYFRELESGAKLAQAVLAEAMWEKAKGGNVAAARYIREEFKKGEPAIPAARQRQTSTPAPPADTPLGKKAQAEVAAKGAHEGTGWGELLKH